MNNGFKGLMDEVMHDSVDSARDRATWDGASMIERNTFGKVFGVIEGALAVIAFLGCMFISNLTQHSQFLMYVLGLLWLIPFIVVGGLLARFRHRLFVRVRGILSSFMGGNRF